MVGASVVIAKNNTLYCIVDYYSMFSIMKETDGFSTDGQIRAVKIIVEIEVGLLRKIVSDTGTNFISEKFRQFCRQLNIKQTITSSCHHQCNGQVEACIKLVKHTIRKCTDSNDDINLAFFVDMFHTDRCWTAQSCNAFIQQANQSPCATNREPIHFFTDDEHYEGIKDMQRKIH